MFEYWLKMRYLDFLLTILIVAAIIICAIVISVTKSILWGRKIRWLKKHGFERYLMDVAPFGDGATYGWREHKFDCKIPEHVLKRISYRQMVDRLKSQVKEPPF